MVNCCRHQLLESALTRQAHFLDVVHSLRMAILDCMDEKLYYHALWAVLCALVASIPWICAVGFARVRRMTLAQIGLMLLVLAVGFAAPRLGLHLYPLYVLGGMLICSAFVAAMAATHT